MGNFFTIETISIIIGVIVILIGIIYSKRKK